MLRIGLIGLGFMGRTHLENYLRLEREGVPIQVTALCDTDSAKLEGHAAGGNIDTVSSEVDYSRFAKYTSVAEMLEKESLDMVDITLPTFLHRDVSVQCLQHGLHVLCEKPMALTTEECDDMLEASAASGKQLMIGQCLRFWPGYVLLKEFVEQRKFGQVLSGTFYRCGGTPTWGAWLTKNELSGGAMLDMHVHDTDMVHWLFGKPAEVSSLGKVVIPGSGYDIVSTNYRFEDGKVITSQADWTMQGDFGFEMGYRVNFEKGNIIFNGAEVKVNPSDDEGYIAELPDEQGYYYQLKYFVEAILNQTGVTTAAPHSTKGSIAIIEAEIESADQQGAWVQVK